jgi:hypothetical protein
MSMTAGQPPKPQYVFFLNAQEGMFFSRSVRQSENVNSFFTTETRGNALKEQTSI